MAVTNNTCLGIHLFPLCILNLKKYNMIMRIYSACVSGIKVTFSLTHQCTLSHEACKGLYPWSHVATILINQNTKNLTGACTVVTNWKL